MQHIYKTVNITVPRRYMKHVFSERGQHFTQEVFVKKSLMCHQAMAISIMNPSRCLTRFTSWPSGVALETYTSVVTLVMSISPPIAPVRYHDSSTKQRLDRVRKHVQILRGVRVILKEQGAEYFGRDGKFFRVLVDESVLR